MTPQSETTGEDTGLTDIELARFINWEMALAEQGLGLTLQPEIPLAARINRILAAATVQPGVVRAEIYRMLFQFRSQNADQQSCELLPNNRESPVPQHISSVDASQKSDLGRLWEDGRPKPATPELQRQADERSLSLACSGPPQTTVEPPPVLRWAPLPGKQ